jgi:hypothetical protein
MKELLAQELKAHPAKGYYRWKAGKDTTYHCGLAHVFYDNEVKRWMCDSLCHVSWLDSVSNAVSFYGPVSVGSKDPFRLFKEKM